MQSPSFFAAQTSVDTEALAVGMALFAVGYTLCFVALAYAVIWQMFERAGQPGWKALVPFYSLYIMNRIGRGPGVLFGLYIGAALVAWLPVMAPSSDAAGAVRVFSSLTLAGVSVVVLVNFVRKFQHPNQLVFILLFLVMMPGCLFMMRGIRYVGGDEDGVLSRSSVSPGSGKL